jgi:hypothetical protein
MNKEQAAQLRQPFDPKHVATLKISGGELQYVGHAEVTDRLLEVDPEWSWEPVAFDDDGLPRFDEHGGLWIRLTVCGVTRYGYGEPQGRKVHDRRKGAISNAIRVAAMRFGVALDLWHKDIPDAEVQVPEEPKPVAAENQIFKWKAEILAAESEADLLRVGKDVGAYAMSENTHAELLAAWNARKAALS